MPRIVNLALGGVGVDGTPFVGALKHFQKSPNNKLSYVKRVVGTSTGGIIAMMIALNYTVDEIERFCIDELTTHKLENKNSQLRTLYDGRALEDLIKHLISRKTEDENFTFEDLDPKKGYKDLHIITMMAYMQNKTPQTQRHIFNKKHTGKTKIRDAVLAGASYPGLFPIIFLDRIAEACWEKGTEYPHITTGGLDYAPPLEEFFDKTEFLPKHKLDEKHHQQNVSNAETLCFISHSNLSDEGEWKPLPQDNGAEFMYALTTALTVAFNEELEKSEKTKVKKHKRTILLENNFPTAYGDSRQKRATAQAAEEKVQKHMSMKPIEENQAAEASSSSSTNPTRRRFSGIFSSSPSQTPKPSSPTSEKEEEKHKHIHKSDSETALTKPEPEKKRRCLVM